MAGDVVLGFCANSDVAVWDKFSVRFSCCWTSLVARTAAASSTNRGWAL